MIRTLGEIFMKFDRYVVVYDIADTKRRNKVYNLLKGCGERVNFSVFECEIKKGKLKILRKEIQGLINEKEDLVIYYPLCLNCLAAVVSDGLVVSRKLDKIMFSI